MARSILPLFVALLSMVGSVLAQISPAEAELLVAAREVRAATLLAVPSGSGIAEVHTLEQGTGTATNGVSTARVEFWFSGLQAMFKQYPPGEAQVLSRSVLNTDKKSVRYLTGRAGAVPPSVLISKKKGKPLFSPHLDTWSFAEIAEIPALVGLSENEFFDLLSRAEGVSVRRDKHLLHVDWKVKLPTEVQEPRPSIRKQYTFDMVNGGMLVQFGHWYDLKSKGRLESTVEEWNVSWKRHNDVPVPVRRIANATLTVDGKESQHAKSEIDFRSFETRPVSLEEVSAGAMGILPGVPVMDEILGIQFRFFDGAAQEMMRDNGIAPAGASPYQVAHATAHSAAAQPNYNAARQWRVHRDGRRLVFATAVGLIVCGIAFYWFRRRTPAKAKV